MFNLILLWNAVFVYDIHSNNTEIIDNFTILCHFNLVEWLIISLFILKNFPILK